MKKGSSTVAMTFKVRLLTWQFFFDRINRRKLYSSVGCRLLVILSLIVSLNIENFCQGDGFATGGTCLQQFSPQQAWPQVGLGPWVSQQQLQARLMEEHYGCKSINIYSVDQHKRKHGGSLYACTNYWKNDIEFVGWRVESHEVNVADTLVVPLSWLWL